jgi:hypothetical protein
MAHQMSLVHERRDVILYGVSVCAACLCDFAGRDVPAFAAEFKDLYR